MKSPKIENVCACCGAVCDGSLRAEVGPEGEYAPVCSGRCAREVEYYS